MKAYKKTFQLMERLERRGINASFDQANALRRAELTLQRWAEKECGYDSGNASYVIVRDEVTDKPFLEVHPNSTAGMRFHGQTTKRYPIADREKGALKRVAAICKDLNIHFYHQTDPRGCALYVSNEPISGNNYTNGVNCNA